MLELDEARSRLLASVQPLPSQTKLLELALNQVCSQSISAVTDLPPFDSSAMDGYAVRSSDLRGACEHTPVVLRRLGEIPAGVAPNKEISESTCLRIFTGSAMPPGADAVAMQESTKEIEGAVAFHETVTPWENVRLRGEDIRAGQRLCEAGDILDWKRVSILAASGVRNVQVHGTPRIGIITSGSELVERGSSLLPGQIYESNSLMLSGLIAKAGATPTASPLVQDNQQALEKALEKALAENDLVLSTGGVSVGDYDLTRKAFENLGGQQLFWKVAVKPGKPFFAGTYQGKLFCGLPGNPISAAVTFVLLVVPVINRLRGLSATAPETVPGVLGEPVRNAGGRRHFVRVTVRNKVVRPAGAQGSHLLANLAAANGLMDIPPNTLWESGRAVEVIPW